MISIGRGIVFLLSKPAFCRAEVVNIGILCVLGSGAVGLLYCVFCVAVSSFFFNTIRVI